MRASGSGVAARAAAGSAASEPEIGYGRPTLDEEDRRAVEAVLLDGRLTQGEHVVRFEARLAAATGAPLAAAVSSGTAALHVALRALGIGPGSRVVTSANTFLASASAACHAGAEVEFVDVDRASGNLDADALERRLARGGIDAVVAVHFAGAPCDMACLLELKRRFGFALVEDAAHALGAEYQAGGRTWRVGEHPEVDATTLSFHPVKLVTTAEGGAVLVHSQELRRRLGLLREHGLDRGSERLPFDDSGARPRWFSPMEELGYNYRLSDLQAALGSAQLGRLEAFLAARRARAARYRAELAGYELPREVPGHAWHLFVVHVEAHERDALMEHLARRGIGTQVHYYPVPHQPWFRARLGEPRVPHAERHARTALSLPLYPGLSARDQERVIEALHEWRAR